MQRETATFPYGWNRRSFLKLSGLLGLGAICGPIVVPTERAEAVLFGRREYKVTKTRLAMGTFVAMTAIHPSRDEAEEAFGRAFEEIGRLSGLLSRHDPDSPVAELNRTMHLDEVPVEVRQVIGQSLHYYRETGGVFDITVKPLLDLYQSCFGAGRQPGEQEIASVLGLVDGSRIRISGTGISFDTAGMGVTLDGIAKGYIVDRASEVLVRSGIENHLINAGGDIKVSGSAAGGKKWTIAVQDPQKERAFPAVVAMNTGAIATSGNYEVYYDREKLFHHIIDSRSGHSPQELNSVTVTAPSVVEADALSTTVFIHTPAAGIAFVEGRHGSECLLVDRMGELRRSSGWPV